MALLVKKMSIFVSKSYKDILRLGISLNCWKYVFIDSDKKAYLT